MTRPSRAELTNESKPDRKPRVLVAGEFSAGKTRLINGILGDDVLPSDVTATALPPVWLTKGAPRMVQVDHEGRTRPISELGELKLETTLFCLCSSEAPALDQFDLIDTPGNSDPNMPPETWERMLDYADMIVWCTNATQAWRQSEKSVWDEMPARLRANSVLLITHSDRMPDEQSADRVMRRVRREADGYFADIIMASLISESDLSDISEKLARIVASLSRFQGDEHQAANDFVKSIKAGRVKSAPDSVRPRRVTQRETPDAADAAAEPSGVAANIEEISTWKGGQRAASARALWSELTRDTDLTQLSELADCVERFIAELDGETGVSVASEREDHDGKSEGNKVKGIFARRAL